MNDRNNIEQLALNVATEAHASIEQKRKYTGEDYITHPIAVAKIVKGAVPDSEMVAAAYLHDVIEDVYPHNPKYSIDYIREIFGNRVALLVMELTNEFTKVKYPFLNRKSRKDRENDRISKISNDAKTIKLADIIHNCGKEQHGDDGFREVYRKEKLEQLEYLAGGNPLLMDRAKRMLVGEPQ